MIVEINGIKLDVDERAGKVVESYKTGDKVKVLVKRYGDAYSSYNGIIVGFDNFKARPTIVVCYLEQDYSSCCIKFIGYNCDTKDIEICRANETYVMVDTASILEMMDRQINAKSQELDDLKMKKKFFTDNFNKYFGEIK
jgi:hypothetical protein